MIRRPPRSTQSRSSAASDVYKRQEKEHEVSSKKNFIEQMQLRCSINEKELKVLQQKLQLIYQANPQLEVTLQESIMQRANSQNSVQNESFADRTNTCLLYTSPSPRDS
eukprot:TRINITY_DN9161_c0_g1_i1.p1 TRINITY_DN9161_c0_g1~~TRINITY_DN9161_c0_g1_i1.p1  ORF type:complete len:109 (-),score=58.58 TRINITY_DN9161_c0_g1_i1:38-364(-)